MFITEKQLVKTLKANYNTICTWNSDRFKTKVLEEVNLGFGVADVVISKIKTNISSNARSLNYFDIIIYKIIESKGESSFEKIKEITRATDSTIRKSILKLMKNSYVSNRDSLFQISKKYKEVVVDSIAIEAKLKNWRRALDQAYRYKWFSSKSFVVLDSNHIQPALKNIIHFKKLNVGLAEIDNNVKVVIHFRPKKKSPIDNKMWMLLNEQIRSTLLRKQK